MTPLDTRPARRLTSREIAKILSSVIGGICADGWCRVEDVFAALDHFQEHKIEYVQLFKTTNEKGSVQ